MLLFYDIQKGKIFMSLLQPNKNSLSNADQEMQRRGMSSMVGNSGNSKELADARMRLAMSRHQVRSFVRRQEKVGCRAVVSRGKFVWMGIRGLIL